jgi:hypothetical protein
MIVFSDLDIEIPQFGQDAAWSETSFEHSEHFMRATANTLSSEIFFTLPQRSSSFMRVNHCLNIKKYRFHK